MFTGLLFTKFVQSIQVDEIPVLVVIFFWRINETIKYLKDNFVNNT